MNMRAMERGIQMPGNTTQRTVAMEESWNLKALRDDVERIYGRWQRDAVAPCIDSIVQRRTFARYHFTEAKRLLDGAIGDHQQFELLAVMLGAFDKEPGDFEWARIQAAVHITACVHSMHSMADILAHVIYLSLGMNRNPSTEIEARQINIYSVRERLPVGHIRDLVSELIDQGEFAYLAALNNQSKHRSIVPVPYSIDMTGKDEEGHGLKFAAFDFDESRQYPVRWVRPLLKAEYQRQESLLVQVGNALNAELAAHV